MFSLVLNTLEERLETTSKHVLFGEHNVFKQFWICPQHVKIRRFLKSLSFWKSSNWNNSENQPHGNTVLEPGSCCPPLGSGGVPSGHQPASPTTSPARSLQAFCTGHPGFKEFRQKSASLCFTISISNKNSDYKSFPISEMLKRNQIMSANHVEFIVAFSSLAAHWNHRGDFKKHWCLGYTQRFWFTGLGCNQDITFAHSAPGGPDGQLRLRTPACRGCMRLHRKS